MKKRRRRKQYGVWYDAEADRIFELSKALSCFYLVFNRNKALKFLGAL